MVDVNTLGGLSEHAPEMFLSLMRHFMAKSKTSSLGTTILKCHIIRLSRLAGSALKEFCPTTVKSFL